ncbi:glycosyltransferase family 2 protein [Flavobacterium sp. GT2N3]|uniref:glycosyltransferase family 2 protein n=1 Tax=unclassified Flavobacterium TaxID=196869 RepID=UPI003AAE6FFB
MKKLAVLLPTYNASPYLNESIDSILNQTFTDFDLYVYDDCSIDNTEEIISQYRDPRLFYRKNIENSGIAKTLNIGLEELLPQYEYIARMDADDWAYPERFQKQLDFLDKNQEISMCGTQGYWLKDINQNPTSGWKYPLNNDYIKCYLLFAATFNHQSIIFQSKFLIENSLRYDERITTCEDWEMWTRIVKVSKIVNLPDFLIKCRILPFSNHHSPLNKKKHLQERSKIISDYWANFNIALKPEQVYEYYYDTKVILKSEFVKKIKILIKIFNQLYKTSTNDLGLEEKKEFAYMLARKMLDYWKRSKVSRFDPMIWILIVKEVKFINKIKLLRSQIR